MEGRSAAEGLTPLPLLALPLPLALPLRRHHAPPSLRRLEGLVEAVVHHARALPPLAHVLLALLLKGGPLVLGQPAFGVQLVQGGLPGLLPLLRPLAPALQDHFYALRRQELQELPALLRALQ